MRLYHLFCHTFPVTALTTAQATLVSLCAEHEDARWTLTAVFQMWAQNGNARAYTA